MPWCKKNESSLGACRSLQLSCAGFCGSSTCERNIWNTCKCIEIWKHNENICYSYAVRMLSVSIRLGGGSQSFVYFLENCIGPCIFWPSLWRSRAIVERCRTNRPIPTTENSAVSPETISLFYGKFLQKASLVLRPQISFTFPFPSNFEMHFMENLQQC